MSQAERTLAVDDCVTAMSPGTVEVWSERSHRTNAEPSATAVALGVAVLAILPLVLATDAAAQARKRMWTVTCGLPQQSNPILAMIPSGYTGPWFGDQRGGHLQVKTLHRPHPESDLVTEMWLLSRTVGWWRLKAIRVHPDDRSKLSDPNQPGIRQIIDSPFLSRPAVVRTGDADGEETVTGQILARLPDASQLRCAAD